MRASSSPAIVDADRLRQLWAVVFLTTSEAPPVPVIDFDQQMVVVVTMGQQPTSNTAIHIERVELLRGQADGFPLALVRVVEIRPGRGCIVQPAASGPIHIIAMPRYSDVTFRRVRRVKRCR